MCGRHIWMTPKAFELSVLRCSAGDDCTDGHEQHVPLLKAYERKKKCEICKVGQQLGGQTSFF